MKGAFPSGTPGRGAPAGAHGRPHAFPGAQARDAFRDASKSPPSARTRPDAFAGHSAAKPARKSAAGASPAFHDPFARAQTGRPRPPAGGRATANSRTLSNGAALQLVSSRRVVATTSPTAGAQEGRMIRVAGGAPVWVAASETSEPKPAPADAPPPASDYWGDAAATASPGAAVDSGTPPKKGGGGSGGGKSGGGSGDGGQPNAPRAERRPHAFDQDDLTGVLIAIGLMLLLGWMWLQGRGGQPDEEAVLTPQMAGNEPDAAEPLPDPFGAGPVDLRPSSPIPDPPADLVVEPTSQAEAAPVPPPIVTAPKTPAAPVMAAAAEGPSTLQAYFCTASSGLTPAARTKLQREIADWKSRGGVEVIVTGFADTRGPTPFNAQLGSLRADFVADMLRAEGLVVTEAVGLGELDSIEDERNCPNQRRVDIALKGAAMSSPSRACTPPEDVLPLACS